MKQRLLSILLVLSMLCSLMPASAIAEDGNQTEQYTAEEQAESEIRPEATE